MRHTYNFWTKEEEGRLAGLYLTMQAHEVAKVLGRTTRSVEQKLAKLGIRAPKDRIIEQIRAGRTGSHPVLRRWTQAEVEYVREQYTFKTAQEIADEVGRTYSSVCNKLRKEKVRAPRGHMPAAAGNMMRGEE